MITAVDSSVLLDVVLDDPRFRPASLEALKEARRSGAVLACPVVWAEVIAAIRSGRRVEPRLAAAGISFDPFDEECAAKAGILWAGYRSAGGKRERLIPDFLVGAHALVRGARLLTRDRGFYRRYFKGLEIVEPPGKETGPA